MIAETGEVMNTETQAMRPTVETLKIGGRYNWKNQSERLIYIGMCEPRNGRWHQFAKVDEPGRVWCEVPTADLHMLEATDGVAVPDASASDGTKS